MDVEQELSDLLEQEIWKEIGKDLNLPQDVIDKYSSYRDYADNEIIQTLRVIQNEEK